jgi:hypothetical protein
MMNTLIALVIGVVVIYLAYMFYAKRVDATIIKADPKKATPAKMYMDGVDFSPTDRNVLYGYQFKLYYDSTILNGTGQPTEGSFLSSGGGQTFFYVANFTDDYNSTDGVVWITDTLTGSVPGVSGSGVLATIEFKSLTLAASTPLQLEEVVLLDPNVSQISYQNYDGTVTVVPEFISLFSVLTLILASLFGILVGKKAMHKPGISNQ